MRTWDGETQYRYSHVKRDGWNIKAEVNSAGRIHYWTSGWAAKDLTFLPQHSIIFENVPPLTILHCELWKPSRQAAYVSSGIANQDAEMHLDVFAIESKATPKTMDLEALKQITEDLWGLTFIPFELGMKDQSAMHTHAEGWVYKNGNLIDHVKYKPFRDATLRVTGIEPGKGKFEGLIGSLEVAKEDGTVVANVSGMDDVERQALTVMHNQNDLVGRLVDVSYQYVNTKGKLRHANFLRLRDDKAYADKEL